MVYNLADKVGRGFYFAIIDEVDSILIDEARTPLIISSASKNTVEEYYTYAKIALMLKKDLDYKLDEKKKTLDWLDKG